MSRLLRAFRMLPPLLAAACLPAFAQAYGATSAVPGFDRLIGLLGLDGLNGDQRDLLALALVAFAVCFGYVSHLSFRESGFGIVLNGLVGVAGSCIALYLLGPRVYLLGPNFHLLAPVPGCPQDFMTLVLVAGAAVPALILVTTLANLLRRAAIGFLYGRSRRKLDAERAARVTPDLPPRIAGLLKK
jgi:hypothetical protein